MKKTHGTFTLIISTIVILLINLSNLIEYLDTGYVGGTFSNICFIAGDICIIIGWVLYFFEKKRKKT